MEKVAEVIADRYQFVGYQFIESDRSWYFGIGFYAKEGWSKEKQVAFFPSTDWIIESV